MTKNPKRYGFHGIRKGVYNDDGWLLYVDKNTLANRFWDFVEGSIIKLRSWDLVSSHFPVKQFWDFLAVNQVLFRPDFSLLQKWACFKFYWHSNGIK